LFTEYSSSACRCGDLVTNNNLNIVVNLRRKVRTLRQVIRRRDKQIRTLSEGLDACRQRNLLSSGAHTSLTETFTPVARELILNEVSSADSVYATYTH